METKESGPSGVIAALDRDALYSSSELQEAGLSRLALRRLLSQGKLESPAKGVYLRAGSEPHMLDELAVIAKRCPEAVFNLYTAARFHGVTQAIPPEIWIRLPALKSVPSMGGEFQTALRCLRTRDGLSETLMEETPLRGVALRFTSMAATVVEMWRYSSLNQSLPVHLVRINDENALECMAAYLERQKGATRDLAVAARGMSLSGEEKEAFAQFCKQFAGGYAMGQSPVP